MGEKHEFKVGDTVLLKVGRNKVQVKILKPMGRQCLHGEEPRQRQRFHHAKQSP